MQTGEMPYPKSLTYFGVLGPKSSEWTKNNSSLSVL